MPSARKVQEATPLAAPTRRDPRRRRDTKTFDRTRLVDANPEKKYCLVHPGIRDGNIRSYEGRGWQIEQSGQGNVRLAVGNSNRPGEPVEHEGHILMSIDKVEWDRIEREGQYGEAGQELFDDIEERIIDPNGGIDPARGMTRGMGGYLTVVNETTNPWGRADRVAEEI